MSERDQVGSSRRVSRRGLLAVAGGLGIGGASLAACGGTRPGLAADANAGSEDAITFWGSHQAGIASPAQSRLHFAAFDVVTTDRAELMALLQEWTAAAARMTKGQTAAPLSGNLLAPPEDTGEALDLGPANLTVTFGFGPGLFSKDGDDRFGLGPRRPPALVDLPAFAGDQLDPNRSGGDLAVQACADDPQVAFHCVRDLARKGLGVVAMRWSQLGFDRTSVTTQAQSTPRNLMGFKDGTDNIRAEDTAAMSRFVWVGSEGPSWMRGGSYLVTRRIRMTIELWDRTPLGDQEQTIGRHKRSGAPLGSNAENDPVDLKALHDGQPVIPANSHIRLASPDSNGGQRIMRRGYSFTDGMDSYGELDTGLFFICYQRDPRRQFIPIYTRLAATDALNEYVVHTGSAVFACPRGTTRGRWVGQGLFA